VRFTLDSNILVRAATNPSGPALRLLDIILEEVERVLLYPRIQARYRITAVEAARFAESLADAPDLVERLIDRPVTHANDG
jgi:predicted nucleic acid-binding protein